MIQQKDFSARFVTLLLQKNVVSEIKYFNRVVMDVT